MGGHLLAVAIGVVALAQKVEHRLAGSHPQDKVHAEVTIVRRDVVLALAQGHCRAHLGRFLPSASDHERGTALAVHRQHPLVQAASQQHVVVHLLQLVFAEEVVFDRFFGAGATGAGCAHQSLLR